MKTTLVALLFSFFALPAFSQTTINIEDVSKHVGQKVTVCAKVYGVKYLDRSKSQPTFINLGAAYPNSPLTVVIFGTDRQNFKPTPEELYDGKELCVTGEVKSFKGRYEIVVAQPTDLVVKQ
jgi:DNA/RNA endonuclease YhcR with UshA esterase domain